MTLNPRVATAWLLGGALAFALGVALAVVVDNGDGDGDPAPATPSAPAPAPAPVAPVAPVASPTPAQAGDGFMAQLAAYASREGAERGFARLKAAHPKALAPFARPDVARGTSGANVVYRLRVGPLARRADAAALCATLAARGQGCLVRAP